MVTIEANTTAAVAENDDEREALLRTPVIDWRMKHVVKGVVSKGGRDGDGHE